jgi:hypothetical protein
MLERKTWLSLAGSGTGLYVQFAPAFEVIPDMRVVARIWCLLTGSISNMTMQCVAESQVLDICPTRDFTGSSKVVGIGVTR